MELSGLGRTAFKEVVEESFEASEEVWTAVDLSGRPFIIWGVATSAADKLGFSVIWMLCTEQLKDFYVPAIRTSKKYLRHVYSVYGALGNLVHKDNAFSVRLLKGEGFKVIQEVGDYVVLRKGE
jgi:hypothetical protein